MTPLHYISAVVGLILLAGTESSIIFPILGFIFFFVGVAPVILSEDF